MQDFPTTKIEVTETGERQCRDIFEGFPMIHDAMSPVSCINTTFQAWFSENYTINQIVTCKGEVSEWSKEHAWKACVPQGTEGSNPSLSAINSRQTILSPDWFFALKLGVGGSFGVFHFISPLIDWTLEKPHPLPAKVI